MGARQKGRPRWGRVWQRGDHCCAVGSRELSPGALLGMGPWTPRNGACDAGRSWTAPACEGSQVESISGTVLPFGTLDGSSPG